MNGDARRSESPAKSRVVYAVTSSGRDLFSAMTRISAASVRLTNPRCQITVACDALSHTAMQQARDPLLEEVDELLVCETPALDAPFRNRTVKIGLRQRLSGPFLFLDSDVLVREDLASLFVVETDLAGAANHSQPRLEQQMWAFDKGVLANLGWKTRPDIYLNGGVLFFNDTPGAHRFTAAWEQNWQKSCATHAYFRDQPALNAALFSTAPSLTILEDRFNAQFPMNVAVANNAAIWHYYASWDRPPLTAFEVLAGRLPAGAALENEVRGLIRRDHPWRRDSFLDDLAAARILKIGALDDHATKWFSGQRWEAVSCFARAGLQRKVGDEKCRVKR